MSVTLDGSSLGRFVPLLKYRGHPGLPPHIRYFLPLFSIWCIISATIVVCFFCFFFCFCTSYFSSQVGISSGPSALPGLIEILQELMCTGVCNDQWPMIRGVFQGYMLSVLESSTVNTEQTADQESLL